MRRQNLFFLSLCYGIVLYQPRFIVLYVDANAYTERNGSEQSNDLLIPSDVYISLPSENRESSLLQNTIVDKSNRFDIESHHAIDPRNIQFQEKYLLRKNTASLQQVTSEVLLSQLDDVTSKFDNGPVTRSSNRTLQASSCDLSTVTSCISWNKFVDSYNITGLNNNTSGQKVYNARVVIPCGVCVELANDNNVYDLVLNDGLDVQGKLMMTCRPAMYQNLSSVINIRTTMIVVQGQWDIDATCKAVDGKPLMVITMLPNPKRTSRGEAKSIFFKSIHTYINDQCVTSPGCDIGEKSITIAGGKVNLMGIPESTPTWLNLYDVVYDVTISETMPKGIVVSKIVENKWKVGATIIMTSFTNQWDRYQQVRTIQQVVPYTKNPTNYVTLILDNPFDRPTTLLDDSRFAIEVALLSRNVVFTAVVSPLEPLHGGHFWFFHTNAYSQKIYGIDIQNFGQQGLLGRYPIHLHHCKDLVDTIVSKNTIRHSFQRCIVIHGTNFVRIQDNVAYDTAGHCYMTEDGIEIGNIFQGNIGIMTRKPDHIIPKIESANNGEETDRDPSTFWITNANNTFINNVAAGSHVNGFWFELLTRGKYVDSFSHIIPKHVTLAGFSNNVAHSNAGRGYRTYPSGYSPIVTAHFIGLKAYRNVDGGIFFHRSSNIHIEDGVFADNGVSIDFDGTASPLMRVMNVTIIGESDSYRTNVRTKNINKVCLKQGKNVGIELHTKKTFVGSTATSWEKIEFSGFNHDSCNYTVPISVLQERVTTETTRMFDFFTTVKALVFKDTAAGISPIDFCVAEKNGVYDAYLTDLDGSLNPSTLPSVVKPSSIISLQPNMLQFVDKSKCISEVSKCYSYCKDTCFRGIIFEVDPSFTSEYKLKICQTTNPSSCILSQDYRKTHDTYSSLANRYFEAYLPIGSYNVEFVDKVGKSSWPSFADALEVDTTCPQSGVHSVTLKEPRITERECGELIRNGDMDATQENITHWLTRSTDLDILSKGYGVGGSNALSNGPSNTNVRFLQYIDSRCLKLMEGKEYILSAQIKQTTPDGKAYICNPEKKQCPIIGFSGIRSYSDAREGSTGIPDLDFRSLSDESSMNVGSIENSFQVISRKVTLKGRFTQGKTSYVYIDSFDHQIIVDNVSMRLVSGDANDCNEYTCFDFTSEEKWNTNMFGKISTSTAESSAGIALKYSKRNFLGSGPKFKSDELDAIIRDQNLVSMNVSVNVRLYEKGTTTGVACSVSESCPFLDVHIKNRFGFLVSSQKLTSYVSSQWNPDGFNALDGQVDLTLMQSRKMWKNGATISISFTDVASKRDLVWSNFQIRI